nr:hypothetical protein [Tanacetum cinerariifolium]
VGCESYKGPHYTKYYPLKEEVKAFEEAFYMQYGIPFPPRGRFRAADLGFYQRDNKNPSYQERRQTMEVSMNKFMAESAKRRDENSILIKEICSSIDAAIRNQRASIKALKIQIRKISKDKVQYKGKNVVGAFVNVPIFMGNFFVVTHFEVVDNMDGYLDQDMGDVIFREPFYKASCVEVRRFDGLITIHNGNDNVTYQMA